MKRRKNNSIFKILSFKSSLITKALIIIFIVYGTITLFNIQSKLKTANAQYSDLQAQVSEQSAKNIALEEAIQNSDDEETLKEKAKEKFGLVESDEIIFYDTTN